MSEDAVVERLKEGEFSDADVSLLTDDDIRQLAIYYATLIRNPALREDRTLSNETIQKVVRAWTNMPQPLWDRFFKVVAESEEKFWVRPADLNNRFGIG
jgi:hypothetical protein